MNGGCLFRGEENVISSPPMKEQDVILRTILTQPGTIAVVGASPNPARPSNVVMKYLIEQGFDVIPVRPKVAQILGIKCYADLDAIPVPVDIVDVFRKAEACPNVARAAVAKSARVLWLQEGIISGEAGEIARAGGLEVVMNECIRKVHERLCS